MSAAQCARGNLPAELSPFVGRRRELADTKRMLSESRLVTLTGIGGVGKTRLATRVAEEMGRSFPDGVWIVELGGVQESALVADTVASTLRLREQLAQTPESLLTEFLVPRQVLLVLDNCEHLIDSIATLAASLLRAAPRLHILATSREPLDVGGEQVVPVPPLSIPDSDLPLTLRGSSGSDAVDLFVQRAKAADPSFELTENNRDTVAGICRRLEGLPLAIELTAARLRGMSAEQVLERPRFRLISGGSRDVPSRQQSLRQCVDWSYDLLNESERALWSRLTVFSDGFELDAAEAVCGTDLDRHDVLNLVSSLVDKSILIREEAGTGVRYRMLETLHEYGRERLQATGDETAMRRRHRDWYEQLAQSSYVDWIGPRQLERIARLNREQSNLCEAMEFSLGEADGARSALRIPAFLYEYWVARASLSEARYWLGRALENPTGPSTERLLAMCEDTVLAAMQADAESGAARWEQARTLAQEVGNPALTPFVEASRGLLAMFSGDLHTATTQFEKVLPVFEEAGDLLHQVSILLTFGVVSGLLGNPERAAASQEQALALATSHGESVYRFYALCQLGYTSVELGDLERGVALCEEGLQLGRAVDDPPVVACALATLGWVAAQRGQAERAAVLAGSAESVGRSAGGATTLMLEMFGHHRLAQQKAGEVLGLRKYDAATRRGHDLDLDGALAYVLAAGTPPPSADRTQQTGTVLTRREQQVAALVAEGLSNRAIAAKLVISPRTVAGHVEHILSKLQFATRTQIAAWVVETSHRAAQSDPTNTET